MTEKLNLEDLARARMYISARNLCSVSGCISWIEGLLDHIESDWSAEPTAPTEPDHLMHLVLTWAERGMLTMSDEWRNRRVQLLGNRISEAAEMAANNLYLQGLIMVTSAALLLLSAGAIRTTEAGRRQLALWDIQAAGVAEPVAPTAHTPTCLDDQE